MKKYAMACAVLLTAAAALPLGAASERIDYQAINKIKQQGLNPQNSQVMDISSWLTDVYGPRLTGAPNTQKAGEWAVAKMKEWGLQNVALEPWTNQVGFERGRPAGRRAPTDSSAATWSSSRKPRPRISRNTRAS